MFSNAYQLCCLLSPLRWRKLSSWALDVEENLRQITKEENLFQSMIVVWFQLCESSFHHPTPLCLLVPPSASHLFIYSRLRLASVLRTHNIIIKRKPMRYQRFSSRKIYDYHEESSLCLCESVNKIKSVPLTREEETYFSWNVHDVLRVGKLVSSLQANLFFDKKLWRKKRQTICSVYNLIENLKAVDW